MTSNIKVGDLVYFGSVENDSQEYVDIEVGIVLDVRKTERCCYKTFVLWTDGLKVWINSNRLGVLNAAK